MEYRRLGKTALDVSVLGFGSSPLGNVYGDLSSSQIQASIDAAIDCGINFFDSSPYYGLTLAEERLGIALEGRRKEVILATKCGRYGLSDFDFSRTTIRSRVEASLHRLRTDYLDLLQAHDIEFAEEDQIVHETIPALRELQAEGKVRYIGITGYPVEMLRRVAEAAPVDTILSYCRYSLLNTDMEEVLASMKEQVGLVNASPMMMGLLTDQGGPAWHPASTGFKAAAQKAVQEARARGVPIARLALQFALDQKFASSTLVGMCSAQEVHDNVAVVGQAPAREIVDAVRAAAGKDFASTWRSGLPKNG